MIKHIWILALLVAAGQSRAAKLPEVFTAIPVLIGLSGGSSGSGFYLVHSNYVYLVTARHVLFTPQLSLKGSNATFTSHVLSGTNGGQSITKVDLAGLEAIQEIKAHPTHDVAVVRFAVTGTNNQMLYDARYVASSNQGASLPVPVRQSQLRRLQNVRVADDVFVFGYPSSLGLQSSPKFNYSKPLLRKGIVAGIYEEGRTLVVDSAVYFGNSGGPVIVREEVAIGVTAFHVVGIVSEYIPFVDVWESKRFGILNHTISNSGYAVVEPVDFILELLWE